MLIAYFDEVKPSGTDQPYYILGGLVLDETIIPELEQEINELAVKCFGTETGISKQTEFHATDIASGRKNFKKLRNPKERFNIIKELIKIYDKEDLVFRVAVRLNVDKLYEGVNLEEMALMYFIEKVNSLAVSKNTTAMLIGDFEKEKIVTQAVQNLAIYKKDGTPYAFGKNIKNILDTVHFAHSHNSRLLQLADTYLWTFQLRNRTETQSELRTDLLKFINEETDTNWPHKYKYWPSRS